MAELIVQKREILGKKANSLRGGGFIPAELYGHGTPNAHLSVPAKEFLKVLKEAGESTIVKLKVKGDEGKTGEETNVLIYDVQKNPLSGEINHIDFYSVRMDEKITTSVPLEFIGVSAAVKEKNGVLIKAVQEIKVEALPADLPRSIEVDISKLSDIGMNIHIRDLEISEKIKVFAEPETVVATISEQVKEEIEEKPITVEEVKVEGEEKREEKKEEEEKPEQKEKK